MHESLSTWEIKHGMDQVDEMMADMQQNSQVNEIIGIGSDDLQDRISDVEAEIAAEMERMDNVMGALDIDSSSISVETTEEELLDELAKGSVDIEDLDFDAENVVSDDESQDDFEFGFSSSSSI